MLSLRDTASMRDAAHTYDDPDLQQLLAERMEQLSRHYRGDLGELAHFLVVEPGDSLREIEEELGFSPLMLHRLGNSQSACA